MKRKQNESEEVCVADIGNLENEANNEKALEDPSDASGEANEVIYKKRELNDHSAEKIATYIYAAAVSDGVPASLPDSNASKANAGVVSQEGTTSIEEEKAVASAGSAGGNEKEDADEAVVAEEEINTPNTQNGGNAKGESAAGGAKQVGESVASIGSSESIKMGKSQEGGAKGGNLVSKLSPQQIEELKLQYLNARDLKKLVELCSPLSDIYKEYQKLKYKNKIYSIDDLVLIQNADDMHNDFIGKLARIIRIENQGKFITLIQIRWYYKKDDLPKKKFENMIDCISDNEIFETDHLDITFVDCINGPCRLYNYHDFDKLGSVSQNSFYTRAKYDTLKKKLNPPFEKWEGGCICNRPLNPDYLYIQCEKCEKWFHITCVGIKERDINKIENYKCPPCVAGGSSSNSAANKLSIKDLQVITQEEVKDAVVAGNKRAAAAAAAASTASTGITIPLTAATPAPLETKRTRNQSHAAQQNAASVESTKS